MTLIKSISGIRGTIGGAPGDALTPVDIVKFVYAYCVKLRERRPKPDGERYRVVVGKDARISGEMVEQVVCGTLLACGVDVVKAGYASTPTTEMAVIFEKADGGIILTASHNPKQWNALKLLNEKGEFLNAEEGAAILACAEDEGFNFCDVDSVGHMTEKDFTDMHKVNCTPDGQFAHNPEPLPANLTELCDAVVRHKADLGVSVDPDVDRLALICETGQPFGEEYTLVSVADYLLSRAVRMAESEGRSVDEVIAPYSLATVSNLSSSRALRDVTESYGGKYFSAAVGEVNVTTRMRECGALIGGEGNGGVIYPALHYGRDAIVGTALFLTSLAYRKCTVSGLLKTYPQYFITKNRIELSDKSMIDRILDEMKRLYASEDVNDVDGVKISFESRKEWVHLRKSNTEPIIRIYAESSTEESAVKLAQEIKSIADRIIAGK